MPIYKQTTEITNIDDLLSSVERDIEEVYFGDKQVFTVWGEYDGSLPAQYSANGSTLADYRIYGSAGGVGDDSGTAYGYEVDMAIKSRNVMPSAAAEVKTENGVTISCDGEGRYHISGTAAIQTFIEFDIPRFTIPTSVGAGGNGTFSMFNNFSNSYIILFFYNSDYPIDSWICIPFNRTHTAYNLMSGKMCNKIKFQVDKGTSVNGVVAPMFTEDGILPTIYQPHSNITTPIYIGSSPLNAYEYIDYASGKIYRWSNNQLSVPEVREKTNEEVTCTVSNDGVYTLTVSDTVQSDRILSFSYNPVETPDGKTWVVAAFAENILDDNGMITLGDAIHPVASAYIRNNGYNVNRASSPSATTYILDRMAITVRAGTPAGTFTLRPMLMYIEPTDPPIPLPALPTVDGVTITDYAGQSAAVPSRFYAKYRKEGF